MAWMVVRQSDDDDKGTGGNDKKIHLRCLNM